MLKSICFLSGYFNRFDLESKSQGGAEYQNYILKNEIEKLGHQVYFISVGDRDEKYSDGKTIIFYIAKRKFSRHLGDNFFLYIPKIYHVLKLIDPDYIYIRGGTSWLGLGTYFSKKFNKKCIWAVASDEDVRPIKFERFSNCLFNRIDRGIANYGKRRSDVIITQTESQDKDLFRTYGLVANEIIPSYQFAPTEPIIKSKESIKVIWIANFTANKQPEMFVEIAKLMQKHKNLEFIMIGRPFKKSVQTEFIESIRQQTNIKYLGYLSQDEINLHLSQSHILVSTSIVEGYPNVFIQAMLRRVVIVSLYSDPDKIFAKFNCGYCSNGSLTKLVNFISELGRDQLKLKIMSQNAVAYSYSNHLAINQIQKIMKYIN